MKEFLTVKKVSWLLAVAIILLTLGYASTKYLTNSQSITLDCPLAEGSFILPRTYQQDTLFLSYDWDEHHLGYLRSAVRSVLEQDLNININIIIPQGELDSAYQNLSAFRKAPYKKFVKLLLAPSSKSLWVQDYLEDSTSMKTGDTVLLQLPYWGRESDMMPKFLAMSNQWDFIEAPAYPEEEEHGNGDYGGNIEALPYSYILIGDSMAITLEKHLNKHFPNQQTIVAPVDWLANGHVDEIYTLLPTDTNSCGFAIGYASPKKAFEILKSNTTSIERIAPQFPIEARELSKDALEYSPESLFADCMYSNTFFQCHELVKANQFYGEKIEFGLELIKQELGRHCSDLKTVALPQLFFPFQKQKQYGEHFDQANAFNPNLVNTVLIGKHIYYSWQSFSSFASEAYKIYSELGLVPRPVVSNVLHHLNGGLHCASMMTHKCKPIMNK